MAAEAVREGFATIVAAGGDGTLNEVVNGIADVPQGLESARLGIMPLGTVNVFARELGLPRHLAAAARTLTAGSEIKMDLGRAEFSGQGKNETRHFLQLAGAGLDARAVELVSWELKQKIGPLAYVVAGIKAMRERQEVITVEGGVNVSGCLVLVGNGRYYGGSFEFFPGANLRDGALEVCVMPRVTLWRGLEAVLGIATGRVYRFWPARRFRSASLSLNSAGRTGFQLDGEFVGTLPARITVLPQALRVVVP